jgi:Mrp family chromosome partitioning ATPase
MSRGNVLKFMSTLMSSSFTLAPEPARLRPVRVTPVGPAPEPVSSSAPAPAPEPFEVYDAGPPEVVQPVASDSKTTLMRWTDTRALATVSRSPSVMIEEVDLSLSVDPRLVLLWDHASEQARAYRLMRHRLLTQSDPRVLVVTSAEPGEGKTSCAANLALALAEEAMSRVLLVEANLRRPGLADLFRFEPADSFIRRLVVERESPPPHPVAGVRGTRLHVAALPDLTLRDPRLDRLLLDVALQELRSAYDYIVIDAASVLESADANVASQCADGVVMVSRAEVSRKGTLERAIGQLYPARLCGVVVLDT